MDAIVQLIRNGLCCIKDLNLFNDTILYDSSRVNLPSPLHETTPLEVLIGITQFYAFASLSLSGFQLLTRSFAKWTTLSRINTVATTMEPKLGTSRNGRKAASICRAHIGQAARTARHDGIQGLCVLGIGLSFFWLCANSFHVTSAGWIGGLPGLIHALTVAESGLFVLLYYMMRGAVAKWGKSLRLIRLGGIMEGCAGRWSVVDGLEVDEEVYDCVLSVDGWKPFWMAPGVVSLSDDDVTARLAKEMEAVALRLDEAKAAARTAADKMAQQGQQLWKEGWLEYVYFLLNFVAFYGYMLCVLVYYFDNDDEAPNYVYYSKFGMRNLDADWRGNFTGDFMWTLEPIIIIASPIWIKGRNQQQNEDKTTKKD
eukprot:CAMPEP_0172483642 /NCGR_PEP_ID=MMETSP1066-20121228/10687_1 /TAXON_ID=671091 /ORGANISM="Coscinodiscus wailesii, Strain CCMP2513" /LENGTH=369 /DNA_ID=CAMNT_0013247615 /DNA_START=72 /DNA_END=1181 /DNA_ORIENTATION=+